MKVCLENIGNIQKAEFEVGDLTIICGQNNTGKTYAMYALYGFLDLIHSGVLIEYFPNSNNRELDIIIDQLTNPHNITELQTKQQTQLPLEMLNFTIFSKIILVACKQYTQSELQHTLGIQQKSLQNAHFQLIINQDLYDKVFALMRNLDTAGGNTFFYADVTSSQDSIEIKINDEESELTGIQWQKLTPEQQKLEFQILYRDCIKAILVTMVELFSEIFCAYKSGFKRGLDILTAERSGVSMFNNDLNLGKGKFIQELVKNTKINLDEVVRKIYIDGTYALPVQDEIEFFNYMAGYKKLESFIVTDYPEIIKLFRSISGGHYQIDEFGGVGYLPHNTTQSLSLGESASAVRALSHLNFYLLHSAVKGGVLMIDEPELNLHPHNQRKMAVLVTMLVNIGIKVMVTTHSNFFINELNSLMMLHNRYYDNEHGTLEENQQLVKDVLQQQGYKQDILSLLLSSTGVKAYIAKQENGNVVIDPIKIDQYGMQDTGFYDDVDAMYEMQTRLSQGL